MYIMKSMTNCEVILLFFEHMQTSGMSEKGGMPTAEYSCMRDDPLPQEEAGMRIGRERCP